RRGCRCVTASSVSASRGADGDQGCEGGEQHELPPRRGDDEGQTEGAGEDEGDTGGGHDRAPFKAMTSPEGAPSVSFSARETSRARASPMPNSARRVRWLSSAAVTPWRSARATASATSWSSERDRAAGRTGWLSG